MDALRAPRQGSRWTLRLRVARFDELMAGMTTTAIGQRLGVRHNTVSRVRNGKDRPGPAFIGGARKAGIPFDEIFEVVEAA